MNRMKKLLALVLALLMLLSLTACGSFESKMARAVTKMGKLESVHVDAKLDTDMSMTLLGNSSELPLSADLSLDSQRDPALLGMELELTAMGVAQKLLIYGEKQGESWTTYSSSDGGKTWETGQSTFSGEAEFTLDLNGGDALKALAGLAGSFTETGEESIRGMTCTTFSGSIPAELLREGLREAGALEKLEEALNLDLSDLDLSSVGDMPVSISLDNKSGMIVRVTMDLSPVVGDLLRQVMAEVLAQNDSTGLMAGLGLELSVERVTAVIDLSEFDNVQVEIPAEARG